MDCRSMAAMSAAEASYAGFQFQVSNEPGPRQFLAAGHSAVSVNLGVLLVGVFLKRGTSFGIYIGALDCRKLAYGPWNPSHPK